MIIDSMKTQHDRVLINSLPKSGTHLLSRAIEILGYKEYFTASGYINDTPRFFVYREIKAALDKKWDTKDTGEKIRIGALTALYADSSIFRHWLALIPKGRYIFGHIPYTPVLNPLLADLNYQHIFIIRDPRAVISSLLPFVLDTGRMPVRHFLEDDFKAFSPTQRLNFILEGGYAPKAGVEINCFADIYRSMLAWRNNSKCLFIRFEDLVGEEGRGSSEKQEDTMGHIASHLEVPFDKNIASKLKRIYDRSSRTFRNGKIDGWKHSMDAKHLDRLLAYCVPLCAEAGYDV